METARATISLHEVMAPIFLYRSSIIHVDCRRVPTFLQDHRRAGIMQKSSNGHLRLDRPIPRLVLRMFSKACRPAINSTLRVASLGGTDHGLRLHHRGRRLGRIRLANRLSAQSATQVLLLEAGLDTPHGKVPPEILDSYPGTAYFDPRFHWTQLKVRTQVVSHNDPGEAHPRCAI